MQNDGLNAEIHHFFPHPDTGKLTYDEDGDPYLGYYWQLLNRQNEPISLLMGPYNTAAEAEVACKHAWQSGDY